MHAVCPDWALKDGARRSAEYRKAKGPTLGHYGCVDDAFDSFLRYHSVGDLVYGRVTHYDSGHAAVLIDDDFHGWCSADEAPVQGGEIDEVLPLGSEHWVKVLAVDSRERRVWLSARQAAEGGDVSYYEPLYPPDDWPEQSGVGEPRRPHPGHGRDGAQVDNPP